jgi:hypothetical protein
VLFFERGVATADPRRAGRWSSLGRGPDDAGARTRNSKREGNDGVGWTDASPCVSVAATRSARDSRRNPESYGFLIPTAA